MKNNKLDISMSREWYALRLCKVRDSLNKVWHGDVDKFRTLMDIQKILLRMVEHGLTVPVLVSKIKTFELL